MSDGNNGNTHSLADSVQDGTSDIPVGGGVSSAGRGTASPTKESGKYERYKQIVIPLFIIWMGWVSLTAYSGASLSQVSSVLHRRISKTKEELTAERKEDISEIKSDISELLEELRNLRNLIIEGR